MKDNKIYITNFYENGKIVKTVVDNEFKLYEYMEKRINIEEITPEQIDYDLFYNIKTKDEHIINIINEEINILEDKINKEKTAKLIKELINKRTYNEELTKEENDILNEWLVTEFNKYSNDTIKRWNEQEESIY